MKLHWGIVLMVMLLTLNIVGAQTSSRELVVGQAFPDIVFPSLEDGHPLSLAHFRGRKVILHIWASW